MGAKGKGANMQTMRAVPRTWILKTGDGMQKAEGTGNRVQGQHEGRTT